MFSRTRPSLPLFLAAFLLATTGLRGEEPPEATAPFADAILALEAETGGTIGVAAWHLGSDRKFEHHGDELFPAASVIKIHLLVLMQRMKEQGSLSFDEVFVLREEDKVGGSGTLQNQDAGGEYSLHELARLMTVISDNTATNIIIRRLGGLERVNEEFRQFGVERSSLRRYMMDFESRERGIDNEITPRETTELLAGIERGTAAATPEGNKAVLDVLLGQEHRSRMPALLPEGIRVAHKTGSLVEVSHDAGIIYAPSGPIVLTVLTKGITDGDASQAAIQKVALAVFEAWGGESKE